MGILSPRATNKRRLLEGWWGEWFYQCLLNASLEPGSKSCVEEGQPWGMLTGKHQTFPLSINLNTWGWLPKCLLLGLRDILEPGLVSPASCSPQPSRTCSQHTGISSTRGCNHENWHFHEQHPVCQPPSPGKGHQGQESDPSDSGHVRETIFLIF